MYLSRKILISWAFQLVPHFLELHAMEGKPLPFASLYHDRAKTGANAHPLFLAYVSNKETLKSIPRFYASITHLNILAPTVFLAAGTFIISARRVRRNPRISR